MISRTFYERNRSKLVDRLPQNSSVVVFSNDQMPRNGEHYFPYRQNSDLLYLCGIQQHDTILILSPSHPNPALREILCVLQPSAIETIWNGSLLSADRAREISGVSHIRWTEDFEKLIHDVVYYSDVIYTNLSENSKLDPDLHTMDIRKTRWMQQHFPLHRYGRLAPMMEDLRTIKSSEEILAIRKAGEITGEAFLKVLSMVQPGVREYDVEAEITSCFLRNGVRHHAFEPVIAAGANACVLHYSSRNDLCQDGDMLLIDFGAEWLHYASDCTRTIPVSGRFTPRQRALYDATLRMFRKAMFLLREGSTIAQVNVQLGQFWEKEHVDLGLYSMNDLRRQSPDAPLYKKYFMHNIAHFIGLDVHDLGHRTEPLRAGMVVSCEPGIYIPEEGVGIRLETTVLITPGDSIDLMPRIPIEAEEIEQFMSPK
jgi:Xaa-Pro aminopeptidase